MKENLSVVAIDKESKKIVGAQISGVVYKEDYMAIPLDDMVASMKSDKFGHILKCLYGCHTKTKSNIFDDLNTDCLFDLKLVTTDESVRQMGLMKELVRMSLDMARILGIEGVKTEATGAFSRKALKANGFSVVSENLYSEFEDENGVKVFANVKQPHQGMALMTRKL